MSVPIPAPRPRGPPTSSAAPGAAPYLPRSLRRWECRGFLRGQQHRGPETGRSGGSPLPPQDLACCGPGAEDARRRLSDHPAAGPSAPSLPPAGGRWGRQAAASQMGAAGLSLRLCAASRAEPAAAPRPTCQCQLTVLGRVTLQVLTPVPNAAKRNAPTARPHREAENHVTVHSQTEKLRHHEHQACPYVARLGPQHEGGEPGPQRGTPAAQWGAGRGLSGPSRLGPGGWSLAPASGCPPPSRRRPGALGPGRKRAPSWGFGPGSERPTRSRQSGDTAATLLSRAWLCRGL